MAASSPVLCLIMLCVLIKYAQARSLDSLHQSHQFIESGQNLGRQLTEDAFENSTAVDARRSRSLQAITWTQIWADEFNSLNKDLWSYEIMDGCHLSLDLCGWGNNERVWYSISNDNVRVSGGSLIIEAREVKGTARDPYVNECWADCDRRCQADGNVKGTDQFSWCMGACGNDRCGNLKYTSGRIKTAGKYSIGPDDSNCPNIKVEARIKLPTSTGIWPAFWMLGATDTYGYWPSIGEIDIMEQFGAQNSVAGSLHFGSTTGDHQTRSGTKTVSSPGNWHTYAIRWNKNQIDYTVDGNIYKTVQSKNLDPVNGWYCGHPNCKSTSPFDLPFYIILNVAVGGWGTGAPSDATISNTLLTSRKMTVDWVRVSCGK